MRWAQGFCANNWHQGEVAGVIARGHVAGSVRRRWWCNVLAGPVADERELHLLGNEGGGNP